MTLRDDTNNGCKGDYLNTGIEKSFNLFLLLKYYRYSALILKHAFLRKSLCVVFVVQIFKTRETPFTDLIPLNFSLTAFGFTVRFRFRLKST